MRRGKGFTLIELLIVVAIIGILAALLIPNAITAIQKAKQKSTMKDITTIATGLTDYVTDNGTFSTLGFTGGDIDQTLQTAMAPFYIKTCPRRDSWGNPYQAYLGNDVTGKYGITSNMVGSDDFILFSWGRDGSGDGWQLDTTNPDMGLYTVNSMDDFNNDLVNWSGSWLRGPRTARAAGS